jgi:3-hydroxybutyryl-CoA dehydratase
MYFEDYFLDQVRTSRGRTITETDIVNFAGLSGDFVELHTNADYSAKGPFGQRIAHGALIFSISTGLMTQMTPNHEAIVAFRGVDNLRFLDPVFIGDTIHIIKKTIATNTKDCIRGQVTFETTVLNQNAKPVLTYTDRLLVKCKP